MGVFFVSLAFLMAFAFLFPGALAFIFLLAVVYWWIWLPVAVVVSLLIFSRRPARP